MRVSVSGTIGVGKSTLSAQVADALGFKLFAEPVAENPYLADYYRDPARWGFSMQVFLLTHRFHRQMEAVRAAETQGYVLDRCFDEDQVFAEVNRDLGNIEQRDFDTYYYVYQTFEEVVPPPEVVLYLRVDPKEAMRRIALRGRAAETAIDANYMNRLHESYERWAERMACRTTVLTVDWSAFDAPGVSGVLNLLDQAGVYR